MARTIFRTNRGNGFLAGTFQFGFFGRKTLELSDGTTREVGQTGSTRQIVADGDTINVSSENNFPIRFLGIDMPESRLFPPGGTTFTSTDNDVFQRLLANPFAAEFPPITDLTSDLRNRLLGLADPDAATRHHAYAKDAEDALEMLILQDRDEIGTDSFFLAFAYDALDFFGRLLAYVHPDQPDSAPADRRESYNMRMLGTGLAAPYFIFPNVDPFRARGSPVSAAAMADDPKTILEAAPSLRAARDAVATAREAGLGIHDPDRPILFQAFELRSLARRTVPSRWVIDLSGNDRVLLSPQRYFEVENLEDRLFVPAEFVPLFEATGWRVEGDVMSVV
ncbi:hypothetical protein [Litoreibacter roseus]|uniref:Uncharacterized protein n=1 Tax=Litoreibacter roseus TaxID=2601869 RepID=A0A6N6JKT2_9RHOB|nr:hypothetical protein [Litoreibacter roseus]GFE66039.1 hypothetical protein KIN_31130 [Litoreibacter roseus]